MGILHPIYGDLIGRCLDDSSFYVDAPIVTVVEISVGPKKGFFETAIEVESIVACHENDIVDAIPDLGNGRVRGTRGNIG